LAPIHGKEELKFQKHFQEIKNEQERWKGEGQDNIEMGGDRNVSVNGMEFL
jgi:hypothetical protein